MKKIRYYRIALLNDKRIATGNEISILQQSGVKVKVLRKATKLEEAMWNVDGGKNEGERD